MRHAVSVVAHIYQLDGAISFNARQCISRLQSNHFKTEKPSFQARSAFQVKPQLHNLSLRKVKNMTNNIIVDLSMNFSISIVNLCDSIKGKSAIVNQLLRSGTSIGANVAEAQRAQSKADFNAKMNIALKESYETQ